MNFLDKILILLLTVIVIVAFPIVWAFNLAMGLMTTVKARSAGNRAGISAG